MKYEKKLRFAENLKFASEKLAEQLIHRIMSYEAYISEEYKNLDENKYEILLILISDNFAEALSFLKIYFNQDIKELRIKYYNSDFDLFYEESAELENLEDIEKIFEAMKKADEKI